MDDLKIIKKYYGENMMHLCRELFSTILEQPSVLSEILLSKFEPQKFLYEDIINNEKKYEFKNHIYGIFDNTFRREIVTQKTPHELLSEAGYNLYKCETEKEIQYFKRYYSKGEELCTFDGGRLDRCEVFFAVKKDVDKIKRKDFENPQRQDEYGTSVISIQFTKDESHTLSIKNRYNHRVNNPDATFSNNLDNIIEGLTESFEREYGLIQKNKSNGFEIHGYVLANDGKYYKYNMEINNIYYCPDNIIIDNFEVKRYPKEKYIIMDYFILDLSTGKIEVYDHGIRDSFPESINRIEKVQVFKEDKNKKIVLMSENEENIVIVIDNKNNIVGLENPNLKIIKDHFLSKNKTLQDISLPELEIVGNSFLHVNTSIQKLELPQLKTIGDYFLYSNEVIQELNLPRIESVGNLFLYNNEAIRSISLLNLKIVGDHFLTYNPLIQRLELPQLKTVGVDFLHNNRVIQELSLPQLEGVGDEFLYNNKTIQELSLPQLESVGDSFLYSNEAIQELSLPNLKNVGSSFINRNKAIQELSLPELESVGHAFLRNNERIQDLSLPQLEIVGDSFLYSNERIQDLSLPQLEIVGDYFLGRNNTLQDLSLPQLKTVGDNFLPFNEVIQYLNLPQLENAGYKFFGIHPILNDMKVSQIRELSAEQKIDNSYRKKYKITTIVKDFAKLLKIKIQPKIKEEDQNEKTNVR